MKVTRVELSGYRCFVKAELIVDPHATVLMGPNDTGKSYLLLALKTFSDQKDFADDDQCATLADTSEPIPQVSLEFSAFEPNEIDALANLGLEFKNSDMLQLTRTGLKAAQLAAFKNGSPLQLGAPSPPNQEQAVESVAGDGDEIVEEGAVPDAEEKVSKGSLNQTNMSAQATAEWLLAKLLPILPRVELFEDPELLPSEVDLTELAAGGPRFETPRRLLWLGGVRDISAFQKASDRRRDQRLEDASRRLSRWISEHWSQDKKVAFKLICNGTKIKFYILVQANERFTDPSWHSPAFNWYLSLLAHLLYRIETEGSMPILLMDEPGIHLHPRAQRDLVEVIRSLSLRTQIIYTAHYPYLIDRNFPGQLRLLQTGAEGITIQNKPYHVQGDSVVWEPIRTALGLTVGDSLLFDEHNVIVEGITDQLFLCAISQELSKVGDDRALDLNYTAVLPAGGASKEGGLSQRALAHDLRVVGLFDGEKDRERNINSFTKEAPRARALWLRDFYNVTHDFCIEDMLPRGLYLEAVNRVYQRRSTAYQPIEKSQLMNAMKKTDKSIVEVLEELVPQAMGESPEPEATPPESPFALAKVEVAKEAIRLLREQGVCKPGGELQPQYDRFAKLFAEIKQGFQL